MPSIRVFLLWVGSPENNHFLMDLQMENEALTDRIEEIKGLLREEDHKTYERKALSQGEGCRNEPPLY